MRELKVGADNKALASSASPKIARIKTTPIIIFFRRERFPSLCGIDVRKYLNFVGSVRHDVIDR